MGQSNTLQDFNIFCPKALAGIGKLPETVADRAIQIRMKRKAPGEVVQRFREREARPDGSRLRDALAAWGSEAVDVLAVARPKLPEELNDRAQDAWEPLLAVADLAGEDWPARARSAAVRLGERAAADDDSLGVRLLADVKSIFAEDEEVDRMASSVLAAALADLAEAPWADWHGKAITQRTLGSLLGRFDVKSRTIRLADGTTPKGYLREQFEDAWTRYLAFHPPHPPQPFVDAGLSPVSQAPQTPFVADEKVPSNTHEYSDVADVADRIANGQPGTVSEDEIERLEALAREAQEVDSL